jgi:hypothetical protein
MTSVAQVNTVTTSTSSLKGISTSNDGTIMYGLYDNASYSIYNSTDSGVSWNEITLTNLPTGGNYQGITTNSDGTILYAIWNAAAQGIYYSLDSGVNWNTLVSNLPSNPFLLAIATDSGGLNIITCLSNTIYISTDSGTTFTNVHTATNIADVVCSNNFAIYYYATTAGAVYRSTSLDDTSWTSLPPITGNNNFASLTCSADGSKVFLTDNAGKLFLYLDGAWSQIATGFGTISSYLNGTRLLSATGATTFTTYLLTYPQIPCFKDDSQILCLKDGKEVYRKVQDIRRGDLVKTLRNGYLAVDMIGTTKLENTLANHDEHKLYRCSKEKYPELTEDLIITGHHSILVSNITDEQREKLIKTMGKIYVTDNKYRLVACIDDRAKPYEEEGVFNIWHIALENADYYMNYGIYANGLLVETCSRRYLKEISGMTLL